MAGGTSLPTARLGLVVFAAAHQYLQLVLHFEGNDSQLVKDDWRELAGFTFAHRSLEESLGVLQRLPRTNRLPLPVLRLHL